MTLQKRLVNALASMRNPKKDTSAFKYKYAQLDQVLSIVQDSLATQGLAVIQRSVPSEGGWKLVTVVIDAEGDDLETGQLVMDERSLLDSPDAQVKGSYETYMRRYALLTAFGLAAEDDDGAATSKASRRTDVRPSGNLPSQGSNVPQKGSQTLQDVKTKNQDRRPAPAYSFKALENAITEFCAATGCPREAVASKMCATYNVGDMSEMSGLEVRNAVGLLEQATAKKLSAGLEANLSDHDIEF